MDIGSARAGGRRATEPRVLALTIRATACLLCWVAAGGILWIAGCGASSRPELGEVEGTVTLNGRPLADATVLFVPKEGGRHSRGRTDGAGRYELTYLRDIKGAKVGPHKVMITTATELNPNEPVPARYNRQTTLVVEVQAEPNRHDFDLTTK